MDNTLYDELLQEIFQKLPSSSSSSVSLVSKRWLHLYRSSRTSLSLRLTHHHHSSLSSFLSHHPFLSSLSLSLSSSLSPHLLSSFSNLLSLSISPAPLSLSSLLSLSSSSPRLTSLHLTLPRPISLTWLLSFPRLNELSITLPSDDSGNTNYDEEIDDSDSELGLKTLSLVGIRGDDWGVGWLWRRCRNLTKLTLQSCQGIGASDSCFILCLEKIEEIEFRTCRTVAFPILMKVVEHCGSLNSLLLHDGGSREGLLQFLTHCRSEVQRLDLRLPLDLDSSHLYAMAARGLTSVRLQSCCLASGESLRALAAGSGALVELALMNCDVVEREPGLLATLGQHSRKLRKLNLSHNERLLDKELVSMLVSCVDLVELRVRGCKGLTTVAMASMLRSCKHLEIVDVVNCIGIHSEAVELFLKNSSSLRRIEVEENKLSNVAKMWASRKFIEVVV